MVQIRFSFPGGGSPGIWDGGELPVDSRISDRGAQACQTLWGCWIHEGPKVPDHRSAFHPRLQAAIQPKYKKTTFWSPRSIYLRLFLSWVKGHTDLGASEILLAPGWRDHGELSWISWNLWRSDYRVHFAWQVRHGQLLYHGVLINLNIFRLCC